MKIKNAAANAAEVTVLDAYTGNVSTSFSSRTQRFQTSWRWISSMAGTTSSSRLPETRISNIELAGHVETGQDSFSDPALGGLVTLKG